MPDINEEKKGIFGAIVNFFHGGIEWLEEMMRKIYGRNL